MVHPKGEAAALERIATNIRPVLRENRDTVWEALGKELAGSVLQGQAGMLE